MIPITTHRHGDILLVASNNPPVNAQGHAVREGLTIHTYHDGLAPMSNVSNGDRR